MPSKTFFHLPAEKRQRLLDAAMAEFTRVPVSEASINRIVQAAGIARGSFYQYFADKDDLFCYYIRGFLEELEQQTLSSLDRHGGDVFAVAEDMLSFFLASCSRTHPQLAIHMVQHLCMLTDKRARMQQFWLEYFQYRGPAVEKIDRAALYLEQERDLDYVIEMLLNELKWSIGKAVLLEQTATEIKTEFHQKLNLLRRGFARPTEESTCCPNLA